MAESEGRRHFWIGFATEDTAAVFLARVLTEDPAARLELRGEGREWLGRLSTVLPLDSGGFHITIPGLVVRDETPWGRPVTPRPAGPASSEA